MHSSASSIARSYYTGGRGGGRLVLGRTEQHKRVSSFFFFALQVRVHRALVLHKGEEEFALVLGRTDQHKKSMYVFIFNLS